MCVHNVCTVLCYDSRTVAHLFDKRAHYGRWSGCVRPQVRPDGSLRPDVRPNSGATIATIAHTTTTTSKQEEHTHTLTHSSHTHIIHTHTLTHSHAVHAVHSLPHSLSLPTPSLPYLVVTLVTLTAINCARMPTTEAQQ